MSFVLNKRILMSVIFLIAVIFFSPAQNDSLHQALIQKQKEQKKDWLAKERFFWGGNLGLRLGNPTFVDLSPLVGYMVTDRLSFGVGAIYNYYSYSYLGYKYELNLYGGRLYSRYFIFENVFLQAGWDRINRDNPYSFTPGARIWVDNLLVGAGFRYRVSDNISVMASGMWNLNQGPLSPYQNPIIQIGFVGGF
jgi:hypothetical protein